MSVRAIVRRAAATTLLGLFASRRAYGRLLLLALSGLGTAVFAVSEASARSNDSRSRSGSSFEQQLRAQQQKLQAEIERQRQEMQRAQERAMREAAEQAQREAARHAAKIQAEMAAQQRLEQERAMREMERAREQAMREAEKARQAAMKEAQREAQRAAEREAQQQAAREAQRRQAEAARAKASTPTAASGRTSASDAAARRRAGAAAHEDDFPVDLDDDGVEDAVERRVRQMEKARHRAMVREQQAAEAAHRRAEERAARGGSRALDRRAAGKKVPAPGRDAPPREVGRSDKDGAGGAGRRLKLLDGVQAQASNLGGAARAGRHREAGRGASGKGARVPDGGAQEPEVSEAHDADAVAGSKRSDARVQVPFPGQAQGAEMPAALYEQQREAELIVSDLSPADLETAKAHGFVARGVSVATRTGTSVQRLRGPVDNRAEAERELHKLLPFASVTQNYAYTIFMGSLGEADGAGSAAPGVDRRKAGPVSAAPCPASICFGGSLIKWDRALASCVKDVRIGIIDTSFDTAHPAFKGLKSVQRAFLDGEPPSPYDWHGTAVLSLLAGAAGSGTPGLVPDATFLLATAFRSDVNGNASTDTVRLLAALAWLDESGVDIVNMSFSGPQDPALQRAIGDMRKRGVVFVAAAGNMGPTASPSYPAAYPDVIAVTAINRKGLNYKNANRGSYIDVSAPGVDILTALPAAKQGYRTGTSFAVPFVTAIVATHGAEATGSATDAQLMKRLKIEDLGPPGRDPIYGAGLALAPATCAASASVARREAPASEAWSKRTTLIKAGAGFGR